MPRISQSPEWLQLPNGPTLDHTHRGARAFSILDQTCVITGWCTHPTIFNALRRRIADPAFRLEEYGVTAWPEITPAHLEWFERNWTGIVGIMRERTLSGRVWKSIRTEGQEISVVSFWVNHQEVPASVTELVIQALELPSPVFIDFMDSQESLVWTNPAGVFGGSQSSQTKANPA